jgi:hypothetical protein
MKRVSIPEREDGILKLLTSNSIEEYFVFQFLTPRALSITKYFRVNAVRDLVSTHSEQNTK